MTFDVDIWRAGSTWCYLGQSQGRWLRMHSTDLKSESQVGKTAVTALWTKKQTVNMYQTAENSRSAKMLLNWSVRRRLRALQKIQ